MSQGHEQEPERKAVSRLRPTSRSGQRVADRFEIIARAGVGGMGVVYQALDRQQGQLVALKLIDSERVDVARFLREAESLARIDHPGIVRYIAHGQTTEGEHYLAMEWLSGLDLRDLLTQRTRLSVAESVTLARRTADALEAAHNAGVIHRDLKPSNIFLVSGELEQVRLIDFGVARVVGGPRLTQSGVRIGTPGYFAPEQARGWTAIDARADIFSLGCVVYECLTGLRAFDGESETAILTKLLFHTPRRVSELVGDVPEEISALVQRMIEREPERRPKSGSEVLEALGRIARNRSSTPDFVRGEIPALTDAERTFVSIIVAGNATDDLDSTTDDNEGEETVEQVPVNPLSEIAAPYDARIELLVDGSAAVMLTDGSSVTELALRSCRLAQELHEAMGRPPIAVATGLAELDERLPVGAVIDRASALMAGGNGSAVLLDPTTASLVTRRFAIETVGKEAHLGPERKDEGDPHTVLGRPTPFVGRDAELARLRASYRTCQEKRQAALVQILGAGGLGKTRLLEEFLDGVEPGHLLLRASGDALRADSPLGALAPALRGALQIPAGAATTLQRETLAEQVLRAAPPGDHRWVPQMVAELVGLSYADRDDESPVLREARVDSLLMGDMTRAALEVWLTNEMRQRTVLIIVDDLQWVDHATMLYLDFLLRRLKGSPLFVCTAARPEVTERFEGLFSGIRAESVTLGPLDEPSCAILAREIIGEPARPPRVQHAVAHCHGNPQLLEELVRADVTSDAIGRGLVGLIETRLARLNPQLRRVLRAASVFGQRFWLGGVTKLLGGESARAQARRALHVLDTAELVIREAPSQVPNDEQFRFRSEAVRDAAYSLLTEKTASSGIS